MKRRKFIQGLMLGLVMAIPFTGLRLSKFKVKHSLAVNERLIPNPKYINAPFEFLFLMPTRKAHFEKGYLVRYNAQGISIPPEIKT